MAIPTSLTPAERTMRARVAAHAMHAAGKTNTAPARQAMKERFLRQVDPDGVLPEEERLRRAAHAEKAYFTKLALKSSKARRARAGGDAA